MLILLDENLLSKKLKKPLVDAGDLVQNVEDIGWRGVKDRELLARAEAYPFDVFINVVNTSQLVKRAALDCGCCGRAKTLGNSG